MRKKLTSREGKRGQHHKILMAVTFYSNLLKSRAFFGLIKWSRCKSFCKIIRENYHYYMIKKQSKFLVKTLVYAFNRKKLVDVFTELKNRKLQKCVFNALHSKTKFHLS